jgi:hypothetical protein
MIEKLEDRLLAADAELGIALFVNDLLFDGSPIEVGSTIRADVHITSLVPFERADGSTVDGEVAGAWVDTLHSSNVDYLFSAAGDFTGFPSHIMGDVLPGKLDDFGGAQRFEDLTSYGSRPSFTEQLVISHSFLAVGTGTLAIGAEAMPNEAFFATLVRGSTTEADTTSSIVFAEIVEARVAEDVNKDGHVNLTDVLWVVEYANGNDFGGCPDVNDDGAVTLLDALRIIDVIQGG